MTEDYNEMVPERQKLYMIPTVDYWMQKIPNKTILELGCGDCYTLGLRLINEGFGLLGLVARS